MPIPIGEERPCSKCGMKLVFFEGKTPDARVPAQKVRRVYRESGGKLYPVTLENQAYVNHFETCPRGDEVSREVEEFRTGQKKKSPTVEEKPEASGLAPTDDAIVQGRLALFDHDLAERLRDAGIRAAWNAADPDWKERAHLAAFDCCRFRLYFIVDHVWLYIPMEYETHENRAISDVCGYARRRKWCELTDHREIPSARVSSHHNKRPIYRSLIYEGTELDDGGHRFRAAYVEEVEKYRALRRAARRDERRRRGGKS